MPTPRYRLVIGNKNTSSWSLRPWLAMKRVGLPFEEIRINLRAADKKEQILAHSPAGKVPALWSDDLMIWDSLAILEFLADRHDDLGRVRLPALLRPRCTQAFRPSEKTVPWTFSAVRLGMSFRHP
jgi:glutathione S-transferase